MKTKGGEKQNKAESELARKLVSLIEKRIKQPVELRVYSLRNYSSEGELEFDFTLNSIWDRSFELVPLGNIENEYSKDLEILKGHYENRNELYIKLHTFGASADIFFSFLKENPGIHEKIHNRWLEFNLRPEFEYMRVELSQKPFFFNDSLDFFLNDFGWVKEQKDDFKKYLEKNKIPLLEHDFGINDSGLIDYGKVITYSDDGPDLYQTVARIRYRGFHTQKQKLL